jgi:hypothetical protein
MADVLVIGPRSLAVFVDETGSEDYRDPSFPVFGYGGCAAVGTKYNKILAKPWRLLKRERLGGAQKPFHTADFQKSNPTAFQIGGINLFVRKPFFRFAAITSIDTTKPDDMDAHKAVSLATILRIANIVARSDVDSVDLVFEDTERNRHLIARDFDPNYLDSLNILNVHKERVGFNGYFLSKESCTPGLEVADLVVHTAGRQERLKRSPNATRKFQPDFIELFHGVNEKYLEYISVDSVSQSTSE